MADDNDRVTRYTTPTLTFEFAGSDIGDGDLVLVSIEQGGSRVDVDAPEVSVSESLASVRVTLTQEQSGLFRPGRAMAQVNWISVDGKRSATVPEPIRFSENLLGRVVSYE